VQDWYDGEYYDNSPSDNPTGPSNGNSKVLRGGGWVSGWYNLRAATRYNNIATYTYSLVGFRCAASPEE